MPKSRLTPAEKPEAPPDGPAGLLYHISDRCRLCGPSGLPDEIPAPHLTVWVFEPVATVRCTLRWKSIGNLSGIWMRSIRYGISLKLRKCAVEGRPPVLTVWVKSTQLAGVSSPIFTFCSPATKRPSLRIAGRIS